MSRVGCEAELRTLKECQYSYPGETLSDVRRLRSVFSDLRLFVDFYCFPNKEKKKLVYLAGTVPVHYEGSEYNIPVCIWLHETHPVSRPRCYVCPSVSMVINPSCPFVDASGIISLDGLKNWTRVVWNKDTDPGQIVKLLSDLKKNVDLMQLQDVGSISTHRGVSNLSLLVSEMRRAFQKDTPLYARCPVQGLPPAGVQVSQSAGSNQHSSTSSTSSSTFSLPPRLRVSQWEQSRVVRVRRSYTEELLGIDFSAPLSYSSSNNPFLSSTSSSGAPPVDPLSRGMGALRLADSREQRADSPVQIVQSEAAAHRQPAGSGPAAGLHQDLHTHRLLPAPDHIQMATRLPPDQAAIFLSLMTMEGRSFSPDDVMEAVQLNRNFSSALKFLTHCCPFCQEQVSFSKIITMTHCSCFLCQMCFKTFFSVAIKEKSIDQLVCPQCGRPEVKGPGGMEESMDYFNLLDTQIRHFLPPQIHELFQRKLRDRALQEMPSFRWCAHCSFGMLHEADRLRMDCPSCKKSTCCQCRSPWSPQHQGLSCQQFQVWQQQNQPNQNRSPLLSYNSIECPSCQCVFSLSKGGCLHFTCSQCQHQFCGGCSQTFSPGSACSFSADCATKGLHAHHPRDCLYHLRDWSVTRLHLLLQYYSVSPTWLEPAKCSSPDTSQTGVCSVLELRDDGSRGEEQCGSPAPPEFRGYCQSHYKERLVELVNRCHGDPVVLFSPAEMKAELRRWHIAVPNKKPDEPEQLFTQRLRLTLTHSVPLRRQLSTK